jgi:CRISPR/Cas system CSM-associated protein Csm4 (group 5 of RAMP superfamily)
VDEKKQRAFRMQCGGERGKQQMTERQEAGERERERERERAAKDLFSAICYVGWHLYLRVALLNQFDNNNLIIRHVFKVIKLAN